MDGQEDNRRNKRAIEIIKRKIDRTNGIHGWSPLPNWSKITVNTTLLPFPNSPFFFPQTTINLLISTTLLVSSDREVRLRSVPSLYAQTDICSLSKMSQLPGLKSPAKQPAAASPSTIPISFPTKSVSTRKLPDLEAALKKVASARSMFYVRKIGILIRWENDETGTENDRRWDCSSVVVCRRPHVASCSWFLFCFVLFASCLLLLVRVFFFFFFFHIIL